MTDTRIRGAARSEHTTAPLTWDGVVASLVLALAVPVVVVAVSYPAITAAVATGAALPGVARRVVD